MLGIANRGDATDNATVAWTGPHRTMNLSVLMMDSGQRTADSGQRTADSGQPEGMGDCRDVNFDPTILPGGIGLSADTSLGARASTYSPSFSRRAGETPGVGAIDGHYSGRPLTASVECPLRGLVPFPSSSGAFRVCDRLFDPVL